MTWPSSILGRPGRALGIYCSALYAFLYAPIAVMAVFSFNDAQRNVVWQGFTLKWYRGLLSSPELLSALGLSIRLGAASAALATTLGVLASYALARHRPFRGREVYASALSVPLLMPEIVMGVGLLSFFVLVRIPLNFWSLACAHALIALPYTAAAIRARLLSLGEAGVEEAAMDLGATEWEAFVKVTLPLARPALLSGALLAFTVSFEDFVTSFFISGIGVVTLPIKIYSMMKFGVTPEINALATVLVVFTVGLMVLQARGSGGASRA